MLNWQEYYSRLIMNNYSQVQLLAKTLPLLVNVKEGLNCISFSCPYCQTTNFKSNGKKWYPSQRKGCILKNEKHGYEFYVFFCHNTGCRSRALSTTWGGGISLDSFSEYILGTKGYPAQTSQHKSVPSQGQAEATSNSKSVQNHSDSKNNQGDSRIHVLPRSTRSQQAGLGGILDKKLKKRKESRRGYWDQF
jgi:hypothetical protein